MRFILPLLITLMVLPEAHSRFLVQLSPDIPLIKFLIDNPFVGSGVSETYSFSSFQGFSGNFDSRILHYLYNNNYVTAISPDIKVSVAEVQTEAPRHLARLSRRSKLEGPDPADYFYTTKGQEEVDIYIIDTGINSNHVEFEGRAAQGVDLTGEGLGDTNGHGSHVAGIAGSATYGVAKKANIIQVKVLAGSGTGNLSTVIAGIEYSVNNFKKLNRKAVANLSLGASYNAILNGAVNAAVDAGLPMIVAAGNSNSAACGSSPASAASAVTVGAIDDRYDTIASFSNWGSCVTIFASGVYVTSLSHIDNTSTLALSGTSMSAPIISGTVAMFLGQGDDTAKAVQKVTEYATADAIDRKSTFFRPRTPNLIGYNTMGDIDEARDSPMSLRESGAQSRHLSGSERANTGYWFPPNRFAGEQMKQKWITAHHQIRRYRKAWPYLA